MKFLRKLALVAIVTIEVVIIVELGNRIINSRSINNSPNIAPLPQRDFPYSDQEGLEYFSEPIANSIEEPESWVPFRAKYSINSDTLNDLTEYSIEKPEGTYRIITLGDSYTYGLYVDTFDNWPEQLERTLNETCDKHQKYEVINLAVPAYDLHYSLERFRLRGKKYHSDLVIWFVKDDDFRQLNKLHLPLNKKFHDEMMASGEYQKQLALGSLFPSWDRADQEVYSLYSEDQILTEQKKFIEAFISEHTGETLLLTFTITDEKYKKILKSYKNHERVRYADIVPDIFAVEKQRFENDGHPTPLGHQAISQSVYKYLSNTYSLCH